MCLVPSWHFYLISTFWPGKDEIKRNIPKCFKGFEDVVVVLDCTGIFIQHLWLIELYHIHRTKEIIHVRPWLEFHHQKYNLCQFSIRRQSIRQSYLWKKWFGKFITARRCYHGGQRVSYWLNLWFKSLETHQTSFSARQKTINKRLSKRNRVRINDWKYLGFLVIQCLIAFCQCSKIYFQWFVLQLI